MPTSVAGEWTMMSVLSPLMVAQLDAARQICPTWSSKNAWSVVRVQECGLEVGHAVLIPAFSPDALAGSFDVAVTCFFLDATKDIVRTATAIRNVLANGRGGWWISLGPLKYHFDDGAHLASDELKLLVEGLGFETREWRVQLHGDGAYLPTEHMMSSETYRSLFFVAYLPPPSTAAL